MLILLAYTLGYAIAITVCYRRWRARGVIIAALLVAIADVAHGTWTWSRPHSDILLYPREHDWACHSLGLVPPLAIFTPGALLALWLVQRATTSPSAPAFRTQLGAVAIAFAALAGPVLYAMIHWVIMVWSCDTL